MEDNIYTIQYDWTHKTINGLINGVVRVKVDNCEYNYTSIMAVMSMLLMVKDGDFE